MIRDKVNGRNRRIKNVICIVVSLAVFAAAFFILQRLVMPTYMDDIPEGAMIAEYYSEEKNHDVVFIGDCEVYENFSPAVLWEEYGINSYIRGSAQQLMWQSYYLLEDTLRYEKPKVVVLAIMSMQYNEPQNEAYNRMTLDGMKLSQSKLKNIKASMLEDESFIDYLFPIFRYHSRITELTSEDWEYLFKKRELVTHNGYLMRCDVLPVGDIPKPRILADYSFGDKAYEYLDKIVGLCEENDIKLVFVKAPSLFPHWYDEWENQVDEYAGEHDILYYNFLELNEETGIDYNTDTYDGGLHMNLSGAEKLSHYLGQELIDKCGLESRRGEEELEKEWETKLERYRDERLEQLDEIKKYGKLKD